MKSTISNLFKEAANATLATAGALLTKAREFTESANQGFANFIEQAAQISGVQQMSMAKFPTQAPQSNREPGTFNP